MNLNAYRESRDDAQSGDWLYEVKHDGYRMLARIAGLGLEASWLDGEIVVPGDGGRSSFQRLQNAFEAGDDSSIVYFVFDAPYLEGEDLTRLPLRARKERLKRKLPAAGAVRFSEHLAGNAAEVLEQACRLGLEGLIGKRADSVYVSGRTRDWIKLKCRRQQDFVIAGYTAQRGSRAASPLSGGKIRLLRKILPGKLRERRPGSSCERTCRRSR
jgi:bifunctional non-homologous end joining protein LigD